MFRVSPLKSTGQEASARGRGLTLRQHLILLALGNAVLLALVAGFGIYQLGRLDQNFNANVADTGRESQVLIAVEAAHAHFKTQVQEWKNILLRGNDTEAYGKHLRQFGEEEAKVEALLANAAELSRDQHFDARMITELSAAHAELGRRYREALQKFDARDPLAGRKVDLLVRGMDRATAAGMEKAVAAVEASMLQRQQADLHRAEALYHSSRHWLLLALCMGVSAALIGSFLIANRVTRGVALAVASANRIAAGDMTNPVKITGNDEVAQILDALRCIEQRVGHVVVEVQQRSAAISASSAYLLTTAQALTGVTSEQAASVEETSAAIEQMSASIAQTSENAKLTEQIALRASRQTQNGGRALNETVAAMQSIAQQIRVIDDIAYQTNLLALNAAIEAASAGVHGSGFSVVATEVRKLAQRSQTAAKEIGELARNSALVAQRAGALLEEVIPEIVETSERVQEIASASIEQNAGTGQINVAMVQINQSAQRNSATADELAITAHTMAGHAEQLMQLIAFFNVGASTQTPAVDRAPTPLRAVVPTAVI